MHHTFISIFGVGVIYINISERIIVLLGGRSYLTAVKERSTEVNTRTILKMISELYLDITGTIAPGKIAKARKQGRSRENNKI